MGKLEASYLPYGSYGSSYDWEAGLSYKVADQFSLSAGYRQIRIKADTDDKVDFKLTGPYVALTGTF